MTITPGVYVEELPSGPRPIVGVPTSIAAFVGYTRRGPDHVARRILSVADYDRMFGGLAADSDVSYAVRQYFANGGRDAYVVRVTRGDALTAALTLPGAAGDASALTVQALGTGAWGNELRVGVDVAGVAPADTRTFNLTFTDTTTGMVEQFRHVTLDEGAPNFVGTVVNDDARGSALVRVQVVQDGARPAVTAAPLTLAGGRSGAGNASLPTTNDLVGTESGPGMRALKDVELFNLLCIPDATRDASLDARAIYHQALMVCEKRRAFLLVDPPPEVHDVTVAAAWMSSLPTLQMGTGAAYFPRLRMADPLNPSTPRACPPCGALAGLYARTDAAHGVWKAPAGVDATLTGAVAPVVAVTDRENGLLNPLGLNCLRTFRNAGLVAWGSRTLVGADALGSEWKYIPVRRTALFIEESVSRGTTWAVFEPNDEPLWTQIRQSVDAFMSGLFRQGAFQGPSAREAYFVRCGRDTMTAADIDAGVVRIQLGFAPLKPAEFVVLTIQQKAEQAR